MGTERTGGELVVEALERFGVTRVFGNPGTTELPVVKAVEASGIDYVLALHEDVAVGMAAGYASTRRYHGHDDDGVLPLGVANLHVAPGLLHGLGNLYNAERAGVPLLVTAGNHSLDFRHEDPVLSGDLVDLARPHTKWAAEATDVDAIPGLVRRAVRTALSPPTGPVFLALPLDVMQETTDEPVPDLGEIPSAGPADPDAIDRAAELLVQAEAPALVVGDGVARSDGIDAAVALAEATGARVHHEILACETNFPHTHDQWVSDIPPYEELAATLLDADTLVFVGCSTNTTLVRHDAPLVPDDATCIHVGDDPWQLGKNEPAAAALLGDPARIMADLADRVAADLSDEDRASRLEQVDHVKQLVQARIAARAEEAQAADDPRPSKADLVDAMKEVAADAYIVDEGVTAEYALRTRWPFTGRDFLANKGNGLGYGLSAAVGAAVAEAEQAEPDRRRVLGFVADGSYMYYPQAVWSAVREGLDLTVVVPDNQRYRILEENMAELFGGEPEDHQLDAFDLSPPVDVAANAESLGAAAWTVDEAEGIASALKRALDHEGTAVVDVLVHD